MRIMRNSIFIFLGLFLPAYGKQKDESLCLRSHMIADMSTLVENSFQLPSRPDISFVIADIKYRDNALKILEFGEGPISRFNGYDTLFGEGKIWNNFWHYVKGLGLSTWFITRNLKSTSFPINDTPFKKRVDYNTFVSLGGRVAKSLSDLELDYKFQEVHYSYDPSFFGDYKGLIIVRSIHPKHLNETASHNRKACGKCQSVKNFKKKYSDFLIIDDASRFYVSNKKRTHELFSDDKLRQFRPFFKMYHKIYSKELVEQIQRDFKDVDLVVIKPLNATKGHGVIITEKTKLDTILKTILVERNKAAAYKDVSYRYWNWDRNKRFIVESYEQSKPIQVEGLEYDATLRVVFALHHNTREMYVTFLGSYWKLPALSFTEQGTLNACLKSAVSKDRLSSAKVSDTDTQRVEEVLCGVLPQIYKNMLNMSKDNGEMIVGNNDFFLEN